ncbi:hypothetical protein GJAV_G00202250 [Gymnothorax javanicus]|nr:hypothetical protein GJAV_G00202250 [Gymnothorax javanicus]
MQDGKAGVPFRRLSNQLSLTVPGGMFGCPRSSCSSSELSLSSACSEFSSGSYTWNEGRSSGKLSSLNWEKRLSLGSLASSNICMPSEQLPARKKECDILEGLKRLQRRKPKKSSRSGTTKSTFKDCMNSNEGIYSLETKSSGVPKFSSREKSAGLRASDKGFTYDSDDVDDAFPHPCSTDHWDTSHRTSDTPCGGGENFNTGVEVASSEHSAITGYDSKEQPEKLTSFLRGFLSSKRTNATINPPLLPCEVNSIEASLSHAHHSDSDDVEEVESSRIQSTMQTERGPRRLSRGAEETLATHGLKKDHNRAQSADSRPRPLSLLDQFNVPKCAQSEECISMDCYTEDWLPIEHSSHHSVVVGKNKIPRHRPQSASVSEYTHLVLPERPPHQRGSEVRNYSVLESSEKPFEFNSPRTGKKHLQHHSFQGHVQKKPTRSSHNHPQKGHSIPPTVNCASSPKSKILKNPAQIKECALKLPTETSSGASLVLLRQEQSPSSPLVKLSKFGRLTGSCFAAQNPRAAHPSSRLPCRPGWGKSPNSSGPASPLLNRRHLESKDCGKLPSNDVRQQINLRSPSPPPPPGRSASLLVRPNYESKAQGLKPAVHQNMPSTVRGVLHSSQSHPHVTASVLETQHLGTQQSHNGVPWNAKYCTEAVPQRFVDGPNHDLQKSPTSSQSNLRGLPKKVHEKLCPSLGSGHALDLQNTLCKGLKSGLKGLSLQSINSGKKGQLPENRYPQLCKTSCSLPISLQGHSSDVTKPNRSALHSSQVTSDSTVLGLRIQNSPERITKTPIPVGRKTFVKAPTSLRENLCISEQEDRDHHASITSKGSVASNTFNVRETEKRTHGSDATFVKSRGRLRPEIRCNSMDGELLPRVAAEVGSLGGELEAEGGLFKGSVFVTTKSHLKPVLGMNGAKARSQSFSAHYMQKPCVGTLERPGKVRSHIITNTGDRGSSLTRQSSLRDSFQPRFMGGSQESLPQNSANPHHSLHGYMSSSHSNYGLQGKSIPRAGAHKGVRSLPLIDNIDPKTTQQPTEVLSHPQFDTESLPVYNPELQVEGAGKILVSAHKFDLIRNVSKQAGCDVEPEKLLSSSGFTIEERVMMGIQENVQKGQEQNKAQSSEAKQRTGSSIANWFGFRKSKLPALRGKKNIASNGKEEQKDIQEERRESKLSSVLVGKLTKPEKPKGKKKNEMQCMDIQDQMITENMDKLRAHQIQRSTCYKGKEEFMTEILISPQGIPIDKVGMKEDIEIHVDTKTMTLSEKIKHVAEREADLGPEKDCPDHMIGSSCQTRTLDSGIGTFPLPDSIARATGRHLPKSASSPGQALGATAEPAEDIPSSSSPKPQVPSNFSRNPLHSTSYSKPDCPLSNRYVRDPQNHLIQPTTSGVMKCKRLSLSEYSANLSQSVEDQGMEKEKRKNKNLSLPMDRKLRLSPFVESSSSDDETDIEYYPPATPPNRSLNTRQAYEVEEELQEGGMEKNLSIMDYYYQQEVLIHHKREEQREAEQYSSSDSEKKKKNAVDNLTGEESKLIFLGVSLESLNKLNSNDGQFSETELKDKAARKMQEHQTDEPSSSCSDKPGADNLGSLSDSLYESFSSCTSHGSNDV